MAKQTTQQHKKKVKVTTPAPGILFLLFLDNVKKYFKNLYVRNGIIRQNTKMLSGLIVDAKFKCLEGLSFDLYNIGAKYRYLKNLKGSKDMIVTTNGNIVTFTGDRTSFDFRYSNRSATDTTGGYVDNKMFVNYIRKIDIDNPVIMQLINKKEFLIINNVTKDLELIGMSLTIKDGKLKFTGSNKFAKIDTVILEYDVANKELEYEAKTVVEPFTLINRLDKEISMSLHLSNKKTHMIMALWKEFDTNNYVKIYTVMPLLKKGG